MIAEDAEEFGSGEDDDDLGAEESEFEEMEFGDVVDEAEDEGDFGICDEIKNDDVYKVLGQDSFNDLKKIKVTPSWILNGTIFPAELCDENYANLEMVSGMHPLLSERVRQEIGKWFPVQNAVLPRLIDEAIHISVLPPRDIVVSSPTGSGKTLCYILPIINSLSKSQHSNSLTAVIVAPVQSLVQQIEKEFQRFNVFNITTAVLCGSQAYDDEQPLVNAAHVFFATPGRLIDHILDTRSAIDFSHVRYLVIDEADQMTDLARLEWLATLETLCNYSCSSTAVDDLMNGGSRLQKILVSATLSQDVDKLHQWQLRFPKLYRANSSSPIDVVQISSLDETDFIVGATATPATIKHKVVVCNPKLKPLAVYEEIEKRSDWKKILVFTNKKFMRGDTRLLISSDALSRGIDVHDIDAVINYDKPHDERNFIHRIGRTGRRGKQGDALTFIAHDEQTSLNDMVMRVGHKPDATVEFTVDNASDLVKKYQQALLELKDFVGPDKNKMDADFLKLPTSITAASKFYKSFAEVSLYTPYETTQALLYEHADGVAAQAFLKMADIPFKFIERPNTEFMSPNGNVPFLKVEQALIPGFTSIVEYFTTCGICLCNGLSEVQVADVKAHIALIQENLKIVELYLMWVNNQIYSQVTRKRYGSVYPWPLNHILPHMKRVEILKYLDCLGWKRKSDERVIELAEKTFKCLDTKLGNSMYFSGSSPTELDALAFGHIYTILTTNLPRFELAECVGRYTNLRKFCQRIDDTFFK